MERALFELLSDFAGGRIYALRAPQNVVTPFVVFQRVESDRWRSINGPSGMAQATMQIDVYDDDYYGAKDLAAQIEDTLDGYRGTVSYTGGSTRIGGISLESDSDLLDQSEEPALFRNSARYLVTFEQ